MTNFTELPDSIRAELPPRRKRGPNEPIVQVLLVGKTIFLPGLTGSTSPPLPAIRTAIYVRTKRERRLVSRSTTVGGELGFALWVRDAEEPA